MARLQLHARVAASGSNAQILELVDVVQQARAAVEAIGGEWRGAGMDVTLDPVEEAAPVEEAPE